MKKTSKKRWGFDPRSLDPRTRPQDDFYAYVNAKWIAQNPIPDDESHWGSFIELRVKTEHQLHAIVEDLLKKKHAKKGSPEQMVRDLYRSAMDMKLRNKLGTKPLASWQKQIRAIETQNDLLAYIARSHIAGGSEIWGSVIDQDSKNSDRYLFHLVQAGLSLPEREYYLEDTAEHTRVREAYKVHIRALLKLYGMQTSDIARAEAAIMKVETALAKISMNKVDVRDPEKTYHKRTLAQLRKEAPQIDWKRYFALQGAAKLREVIVAQPKFFAGASKLLTQIPLDEWKIYLEWHLINGSAGLLSEPFIKENFHFYATVLAGNKKMRALWRRALGAVNGSLPDALGKIYVQRHFPPSAKKAMDILVDDLLAAYEERIKRLDWMSPATKRKAIQKLHALNRKIGYPEKWESYKGLVIAADDYFGNMLRASEYEHRRQLKKLFKPVDRKEWHMSPQTVNAYFSYNLNDIVFPAAILQGAFFSEDADAAVNYAAIGSVIGHEISHGFDDQGSKFDAKGNMREWWTREDRKRFKAKAKILVTQFDSYEVADGVKANGKLTLGENIADLAGASIAFDAYQRHLKKAGRKDIDGLTPEQRFFLGFAQAEKDNMRPELLKIVSLTDPHAANHLRVNGPASNLESFYEAFGVKKGDKLYREPKQRAKIW